MFRYILAVTLSGLLFGCGGGGDGGNLTNTVKGPDSIDISKACPSDMHCDFFDAPKDYNNPSGNTVKIHYGVHKATDLENRIGILVFNFGGPGAEAVHGTNWMIEDNLPAEILAKFDIIGMDPRGAGQSVYAQELTNCAVAASKKEGNCDSVYNEIAPYIGTNSVVKDLDTLRKVLGEDKLNFFGYSYGTRIGSLYAKMFPENVRAIVLDSPMAPAEENYFESLKGKISGFDAVVDYRLRSDDSLKRKLMNIYDSTKIAGSYTANDGVTLSSIELENILYAMISQEKMQNWSRVKTGVLELLTNDRASLLKQQQSNITWPQSTNDRLRSNYLFQLVSCTDEIKPLSRGEINNRSSEYDDIAPLFSDLAKSNSLMCAYWPMQHDPIAKLGRMDLVLTDQQILIIAGKYDTNTPYTWGQQMEASFGHLGAFITVDKAVDHGFSYTGNNCVDKNTTQYLLDPSIQIIDETCTGTASQKRARLYNKWKDHPVNIANPIKR